MTTKTHPEPLPARIQARIRKMKIFADDPESHDYIRMDVETFTRMPKDDRELVRHAVHLLQFPQSCPRASCKRMGRCTTPYVVCQFERLDEYDPMNDRLAANHDKYGDPFHGLPPPP